MPHVAVVGAGPSGLFATAELRRRRPDVPVDVLDRLPTPFGLVRYGVAPDHHRIKSVTATLAAVFADERVRFLGNVGLGSDVTVAELRRSYDAVVVATGSGAARDLGIPGEGLPGSITAADLVAWYNGHPDAVPVLSWPRPATVAVVGAGNVALDVARVLLKSGTGLDDTDIPDPVRAGLDAHPVHAVHVVARRGHHDVRFSLGELLAFDDLPGVVPVVDPAGLTDDPPPGHAARARHAVFRRWAENSPGPGDRVLRFHVHRSPVAVLGSTRVTGIRLADPTTGTASVLDVDAVVRAIGYRGTPIPGLPFDPERATVPHESGRVEPGLYVTGWLKRGPSGVIGTNKACAVESVGSLLDDLDDLPAAAPSARKALTAAHEVVDWAGWTRIDRAEIALGRRRGRARTKITDTAELLAHARH
ncbi:FAD-dependent oxidoreductase [Pseudonocardia sp. NPDC049635]|uniref:FAD-dependent oxidoreductase n=1 Tax=Pseudonocardia sp. NPDC049635 TaxID=3155506 RepID=UPI0033F0F7D4